MTGYEDYIHGLFDLKTQMHVAKVKAKKIKSSTSLSNDQQVTTTFTISKVYTHLLTIHLNKTEFQNSQHHAFPFPSLFLKDDTPTPPTPIFGSGIQN